MPATDPTPTPVIPYETSRPTDSLTKYDLAVLTVRLCGLYALFQALTYASYLPMYFAYRNSVSAGTDWHIGLLSACVPCVLFALAGVALLRYPNRVARVAFPELASAAHLSIAGRDLQAVLFSVVGVVMIAVAIPTAVRLAFQHYLGRMAGTRDELLRIVPDAAFLLVEIIIGLLLFARGKALAALWHRLRTAGLHVERTEENPH
jgi:hypothetical protein